ncbi:unnamed protein product [Blepharisma stoltei]|uniref:Ribosomal protein S18 n=1 Tax=Blepharisma stoltei TaxID=1481888 RepID=A0AAU9JL71_9CILI|nr:unnamed protein product [Blepharisma stoltei]
MISYRDSSSKKKIDNLLLPESNPGSPDKLNQAVPKSFSVLKYSNYVLQPLKVRASLNSEKFSGFMPLKDQGHLKLGLEPIKSVQDFFNEDDSFVSDLVNVLSSPHMPMRQRKIKEFEKIYVPESRMGSSRKLISNPKTGFVAKPRFVPAINQKHIPRITTSRKFKRESYLNHVKYAREFYYDFNLL